MLPLSEVTYEAQSYVNSFANYSIGLFGADMYSMFRPEQIRNMMQDPMGNNAELRDLSRTVYNLNGIVANTVDKMVALPTLDKVVVPYGKSKAKKREYQNKVQATLDSLRDRELVRDCLHNSLVDGIAFYYVDFRERPIKTSGTMSDADVQGISEINEMVRASAVSLQPEYTKIIGLKNSSPVLAFDLSYFDKASGNESAQSKLKKFPPEFRKAYSTYSSSTGRNKWLVLNNDHTICVKFRSKKSEPWGRPLALAALLDIYFADYHTDTKRRVLDEVNNKVVYQTFPPGKEQGTSALSSDQQRQQHDAVKQGITTKNNRGGISFFSVASGTKIGSLSVNVDVLDEKNERKLRNNIATSLGFAEALLSGAGDTSFASLQENLKLVTATVFKVVDEITSELNKVINACVLRDKNYSVNVVYLPITYANRKEYVEYMKGIYLQGKGSISLWSAAIGVPPDAFFSILDRELEEDIENKYPVHQTSSTLSREDRKTGRPENDNPTNENTVKSKTNNANASPKPSTM